MPMIGGSATAQDIAAYEAELMGAPIAQAKAIPAAIELERQLMPLLQAHYFNTMGSNIRGASQMYSGLEQDTITNQGRYGNALLGMYGQMGSNATQQAIAGLDPAAQRNYQTMQQQAADELALGTALSDQETQIAQGAARAAAQARGLQFSRQGGDLEVLNTYNMGLQRQGQRRQYAAGALQAAQGMQQYGAQAYLAPAMQNASIYSMPGLIGAAEGIEYGPQTLQMESQYMADIRGSRLQSQMARDQAAATRAAGQASMMGAIGGAAIAAI